MRFREGTSDEFLEVFNASCGKIRAFPGCHHLELLRNESDACHFMTYSKWDSTEALEQYRVSELFQSTWAKTKPLFETKAEAWSMNSIMGPV